MSDRRNWRRRSDLAANISIIKTREVKWDTLEDDNEGTKRSLRCLTILPLKLNAS